MNDQEIQQQIERYINGDLSEVQEDELWIVFLKDPDWFNYFDTYLNVIHLSKCEGKYSQM